ncbi:MAG TPA: alkaline phosphatase family protein, partial [Candidatus Polarisedimenticolia bacterium]|nr:alkaline phosphatase family protein [Candidatus Polarisedimenticolia bacterium]
MRRLGGAANGRLVTGLVAAAAVACIVAAVMWQRPRDPAPHAPHDPVAAAARGATVAPARKLSSPVVLIGLDGADWQLIDPLIQEGRLPVLASLKRRGAWGHLRSFEPILSPLLWTTAATGKRPDEHGIVDFLVADPTTGERSPITSASRRVRALWNIFSERGLSADVVAWWATWPAETINGRMISDRVAYSLFQMNAGAAARGGLTYPEDLWDELRPMVVSDAAIGYERVARFLDITRPEFDAARERARRDPETAYKEPINHLTKILASTETYHRAAVAMLEKGQPDLFAIYYQGIDEVCHRFMHFGPPRMEMASAQDYERYKRAVSEFYVYQDELLGDLIGRVSPESTLLVMSDHGFKSGSSRPTDGPADIEGKPGKWHRLYGVIMIAGAGIAPGR